MKTLLKNCCHKGTKSQRFLNLFSFFFFLFSFSQEAQKDTTKINTLNDVIVSSVRAKDKNPITFTNVSKQEIAPRNLGQDIPILLNYLPSVVTTTDAGNGVGYTYMRVRGADGSRINVTLNGIPFNDLKPIQNINSAICGWYCLGCLHYMGNKKDSVEKSLQKWVDMFDEDVEKNKTILQEYLRPL
jgi:hypothetical protein